MAVQQEKKKDDIILERLFGCYLENGQKEGMPGDGPCGITQVGENDVLDGHCVSGYIPEIIRKWSPKDMGMGCGQKREMADSQASRRLD